MLEYVIGLLKDYYIHGNSNYEQKQVDMGQKSLEGSRLRLEAKARGYG